MANVTVTLPLNVLDKLDDMVEKGKAGSRSQAVRDADETSDPESRDSDIPPLFLRFFLLR